MAETSTWQKLGDEAVPIRNDSARREEVERARRIELLVGPRRPGADSGIPILVAACVVVAMLAFLGLPHLLGN